ncbi:MAG TPA: hypothetical protein VMG10_01550 [Gemmataceae bacterium]|nr:hypothetical protein [Gemmataceae bacterium]
MSGYELRDSEEARRFVLQGLWWQRVVHPRASSVRPTLEWALEIASLGLDLPPTGFLADLGHVALGEPAALIASAPVSEVPPVPALPINLLRAYEDHVLGKLYADWAFSRASDSLRRYKGRDQARGLAFLFRRLAERSGFQGVRLSPGVLKAVLEAPTEEIHTQGWESLSRDELQAALTPQYEMLIAAARRTAEVLGPEDISQLERGTALRPEGEQLAERQVLRAAQQLEAGLPRHRLRPRARRMDVPTRILDEDTYPVGGFTSLATRGSVESLLHSQLAYMEKEERPDLFDIKFLRDELLYYARDENQFLRRRRTFVFVFYPDLDQTRFKDRGPEYQRGVLLLALLHVIVGKLAEWLSTDALSFRFVFVVEGDKDPLKPERDLLASLLLEEINNGSVQLLTEPESKLANLCASWARRSLCNALLMDVRPRELQASDATIHRLRIDGPRPALGDADSEPIVPQGEDALESWSAVLQEILQGWI